jgi:hypothetical protein
MGIKNKSPLFTHNLWQLKKEKKILNTTIQNYLFLTTIQYMKTIHYCQGEF